MNNRNLGRFSITRELVDTDPEKVSQIFTLLKLVPVRVEMMYPDKFDYIAISERFPEVKLGEMIPEYTLKITISEAGNIELVEINPVEG